MFAPRGSDGRPVPGTVHGTRFNGVWKGPAGAGWLGGLFTGEAQKAERLANERLHTGNQGKLGMSTIYLPGVTHYPEPGSGAMIEAADPVTGEFHIMDVPLLEDRAAHLNERLKWAHRAMRVWWTDDSILREVTSDQFLEACAAGNGIAGMPKELVPASCTPSVINYYPTDSPFHSQGSAKAIWLILHHPHARGRMFPGPQGVSANTHKEHPRSARSALEDAVA